MVTKSNIARELAFKLSKEWVPYEGPLGGEGWQNVNDPDDVRYTDEPPGEVAEDVEPRSAVGQAVQAIQAFDPADYEYGEWRGIRWKNVEEGTFLRVGVDEWGIDTELAQVVSVHDELSRNSGSATVVTESGETMPVGPEEATYVQDYFDPMEWKDPEPEPEPEADEDAAPEEAAADITPIDPESIDPDSWDADRFEAEAGRLPESRWEDTESFADLTPGDYVLFDHVDMSKPVVGRVIEADEGHIEFMNTHGKVWEFDEEEFEWGGYRLDQHQSPPAEMSEAEADESLSAINATFGDHKLAIDAVFDAVDFEETEEFDTRWDEPLPRLTDSAAIELRRAIRSQVDDGDAVSRVWGLMQGVKQTASGRDAKYAEQLAQATFGIEGDLINGDPDEETPEFSDSEKKTMILYAAASQKLLREIHGEDYSLHRGVSNEGAVAFAEGWLENPQADKYVIKETITANYTPIKKVADTFSAHGLTITNDDPEESVINANDLLRGYYRASPGQDEGEVWLPGGNQEVTPENLQVGQTTPEGKFHREAFTLAEIQNPIEELDANAVKVLRPHIDLAERRADEGKIELSDTARENLQRFRRREAEVFDKADLPDAPVAKDAATGGTVVIDLTHESDKDWLRVGRENESDEADEKTVKDEIATTTTSSLRAAVDPDGWWDDYTKEFPRCAKDEPTPADEEEHADLVDELIPTHVTIMWGATVVGFAHRRGDDLLTAYTGSNFLVSRIVRTCSTETFVAGNEGDDPYDEGLIEIGDDVEFTATDRMRELILVLDDLPGVSIVPGDDEHTTKGVGAYHGVPFSKEWVPYVGPRGGTGWRSTVSERIVYEDEPPESDPDMDPADLSWDHIEDADIQSTRAYFQMKPEEIPEGSPVRYTDPSGYEWEGIISDKTDEQVILETPSQRRVNIQVNENGDAEGMLRSERTVFFGHGIAGAEDSWLPEGERATDEQLTAEAIRSAAATDGIGDVTPLEAFVAHALAREEGRERIDRALSYALDTHPLLFDYNKDEIVDGAQDLLDDLDKAAIRSHYTKTLRKEWVPYRGPLGGEGWIDPATRDVVYTDEPPGEREAASEGQHQTTVDTGITPEIDLKEPKWLDDEVARVSVYRALGDDAYDAIIESVNEGRRAHLSEFEITAGSWLSEAEAWIEANGSEEHIAALQRNLDRYDTNSPWGAYSETIEAPNFLNPENCDEITPFTDTGMQGGISASSMWIATQDNGERLFITNANDKVGDAEMDFDMRAAEQTATFLQELGFNVPDHHYEDGQFLSVAEAEGTPVVELGAGRGSPDLDPDHVAHFAASQLLAGNRDPHGGNVFYEYWDDSLTVIDLDLAGLDLTENPIGLSTSIGKLHSLGVYLGALEPYNDDDVDRFVELVIDELEYMATSEDTQAALDAVTDDEVRANLEANIEAARNRELLTPETTVRSTL